jgi:hypothetical protein
MSLRTTAWPRSHANPSKRVLPCVRSSLTSVSGPGPRLVGNAFRERRTEQIGSHGSEALHALVWLHVGSKQVRRDEYGRPLRIVLPPVGERAELGGHITGLARSRQTSGFIEALNGLFQAAKRKARGYTRFQTMKTVLFLIAGKLNFSPINPHSA